jgi:hypothetical protein
MFGAMAAAWISASIGFIVGALSAAEFAKFCGDREMGQGHPDRQYQTGVTLATPRYENPAPGPKRRQKLVSQRASKTSPVCPR